MRTDNLSMVLAGHVDWWVAVAHRLTDAGRWQDMSRFLRMTPVRLTASAVLAAPLGCLT
jgi:hypothetical protein